MLIALKCSLKDAAALAYAHNVSSMHFTRVFLFVVTPYFCSTSLLCKAVNSLFALKVNSFSSRSTKCNFLPGLGNKVGRTTTWRACTTSSWATGTPYTYFQIPKLCFTWRKCLDGVYTFCASELEIHSFCHQFVCRNIFSSKVVNDLWDVLLRPQNRCPLTSVSWMSSSNCFKPHAIF